MVVNGSPRYYSQFSRLLRLQQILISVIIIIIIIIIIISR